MEVADCDLKEYIESNHEVLTFEDKLKFCIKILEGIKEIDSNDFYHRDIKPDNIFIVNGKWKIGDLGLIAGRNLDYELMDHIQKLKKINNGKNIIVFSTLNRLNSNIPIMFYTGLPTYNRFPSLRELDFLVKNSYKIIVLTNIEIPAYIKSTPALVVLN